MPLWTSSRTTSALIALAWSTPTPWSTARRKRRIRSTSRVAPHRMGESPVMDHVNDSVTVLITRAVRAGNEAAFEEALKAWVPMALAYPGHLGVHVLRP